MINFLSKGGKNMTDPILKLEETIDDMTQALANSAKVTNQQKLMVKIIRESTSADKFKEFCDASDAEIKKNDSTYETLLQHRALLIEAVDICKKVDSATKQTLSKVLYDVFVAFNFIAESNEETEKKKA